MRLFIVPQVDVGQRLWRRTLNYLFSLWVVTLNHGHLRLNPCRFYFTQLIRDNFTSGIRATFLEGIRADTGSQALEYLWSLANSCHAVCLSYVQSIAYIYNKDKRTGPLITSTAQTQENICTTLVNTMYFFQLIWYMNVIIKGGEIVEVSINSSFNWREVIKYILKCFN